MDRGAWWATPHSIAKSCLSTHAIALGGEDFTVPISQMRKLRPGEVDWLVPSYTAGDGLILGWGQVVRCRYLCSSLHGCCLPKSCRRAGRNTQGWNRSLEQALCSFLGRLTSASILRTLLWRPHSTRTLSPASWPCTVSTSVWGVARPVDLSMAWSQGRGCQRSCVCEDQGLGLGGGIGRAAQETQSFIDHVAWETVRVRREPSRLGGSQSAG